MHDGHCLCGAVRYTVLSPFRYSFYCHCERCRAVTGSAFSVFGAVEKEHLRVVSGEQNIAVLERNPDNLVSRCKLCGSPLFALVSEARFFHVQLGTVVGDPGIRPTGHIFVASKAPWYPITDSLPQYDGLPP